MPTFPKKESDLVALAQQMVNGYTTYGADFPSVTVTDLETALSGYQSAKAAQDAAKSQMQLATEAKDNALAVLVAEMRNDLKISEVDVWDDPKRLTEIGWGPKAEPQPLATPGRPNNLIPIAEGTGFVWFTWDKPVSGGKTASYIIQRRDKDENGVFGEWKFAAGSYDTKIKLTDQPCGVQMEYRCIATNAAGDSMPSNTAQVVL